MKRDIWLYRISLIWIVALAVGIPFALSVLR
jgi:hypothetical protein